MVPAVKASVVMAVPGRPSLKAITMKALGWAGIASAISLTITLVRLLVLSRLITPVDFGVFAVSNSLVTFLGGLTQGLFAAAIVQDRTSQDDKGSAASGLAFSTLLGVSSALLLLGFSAQLGAAYRIDNYSEVFVYIAPALALRCIAQVPWAVLQREHRFRSELACTTSSLLIGTVISIAAAWHGLGFKALVFGLIAETAILMFATLVFAWGSLCGTPSIRKGLGLIRRFGGSYSVTFVSGAVNPGLQCFLVSYYFSAFGVGLFARTQALQEAFAGSVFGTFINRLFRIFPLMERDTQKLGRAMAVSVEVITIVSLPVSTVLFFSAESVVHIVLGPAWTQGALLFGIFALGLMARLCYKVTEFVSYALGLAFSTSIRSLLNLVATGASVIVFSSFGLTATVMAVVVVGFLNYLSSASIALKGLGWSWRAFAALHLRGASFSLLVSAVFLALDPASFDGRLLRDLIAAATSAALIAGFCWAFPKKLLGQRILSLSTRLQRAVRH